MEQEQSRARMNGLHCKCFFCTSPVQDKSNMLPCEVGSYVYTEHAIVSRLESDSIPHHVTDGNWLCTTSRPEVIIADLKNSFDPSNTLFFLYIPSISSLGNLVCPASAVSASQHSKLFGAEFPLNDTLSQIGLDNCTNQAPGRDGQTKDILQGLASISHGHMQPSGIIEVFEPLTFQPESIAVNETLPNSQPFLGSSVPSLQYPAQRPGPYPSGSPGDRDFLIAPYVAQDAPFVDLGGTASYENVRQESSFQAMSDVQPVVELQSLFEPAPKDGANVSANQLLFTEFAIDSSNWYDEAHHSVDALMPTPPQGEQSPAGIPAILSSAGQSKVRTKMISVHCCPHDDCAYTAKTEKDLNRHLATQKHGGSSVRFPCTVEGCHGLKENTRPDNLRRHMKTVHGVIMPERKKGRREKRHRAQSQAQQ